MALTGGRLTTTQRAAIEAGGPVRQHWQIRVPVNAAHSAYIEYDLDVGVFPSPGEDARRVVKAGSRKHVVWNPSPQVSNTPRAVQYAFTVHNADGVFFETHADNVFQVPSLYQATPHECQVKHRVYVGSPSTALPGATQWEEITHMAYVGRIIDIRYEDTFQHGNDMVGAVAHVVAEQLGAWDALRRVWTKADGTDFPMTGTGPSPQDFYWNGV